MELLARGATQLGVWLDRAQIVQFDLYYRELVEWNRRVNLTTVTRRTDVQTRHFLESLAVSSVLPRDTLERGRILDVGTGAGLPGMPLKIAFPGVRLTLIDATAKKTAFLDHLTKQLGIGDVEVFTGRAEALAHEPELRESFDVVVSRAVGRLSVLAELCVPFCRLGGLVVAHKGENAEEEVRDARGAIGAMGGEFKEVRTVTFDGSGLPSTLVVLEKSTPTPNRYPRRAGIPTKRPL